MKRLKKKIRLLGKKCLELMLHFEKSRRFLKENARRMKDTAKFINDALLIGKLQEFELSPFKSFDLNAKVIKTLVQPPIEIAPPKIINQNTYYASAWAQLPPIFLGEVTKTEIIGSTDLLLKESYLYSDTLYMMNMTYHDLKINREIISYFYDKTVSLDMSAPLKGHIEKGIHFLSDYSHNYFHWLFECLPRYYLLEQEGEFQDYPLLVDAHLPKQCLEALQLIVGTERKLIFLERLKRYCVDTLIYPSFFSVCNDSKPYIPPNPLDFVISPLAISFLRKKLTPQLDQIKSTYKKIYVCRKKSESKRRQLLNGNKLIPHLIAQGFEIVYPEQLSLADQMTLFNQANLILCEIGAALSNIIFCSAQTKIFVISSDMKNLNYYFFEQIANVCHLNLSYFLGKAMDPTDTHSDFTIDIKALLAELSHVAITIKK